MLKFEQPKKDKPKKKSLFSIPFKGSHKADFITQIDWNHFHDWKKQKQAA